VFARTLTIRSFEIESPQLSVKIILIVWVPISVEALGPIVIVLVAGTRLLVSAVVPVGTVGSSKLGITSFPPKS